MLLHIASTEAHYYWAELPFKLIIIEIRKGLNSEMNSIKARLNNMPPIQELAFHKQQCEINGVQFYCHESYYEGELLNGIDLKIKQVRGLDNKICMIDYLQETQELIFCASSNLILYNTHKRTFQQLMTLKGEAKILKTHLQKMNNREYIIWIQKQISLDQATSEGKTTKQSIPNLPSAYRLKKQTNKAKDRRQTSTKQDNHLINSFLSSFLSAEPDKKQPNNLISIDQNQTNAKGVTKAGNAQKKVRFEPQQNYFLRVYDYSRKQMIVDYTIQIPTKHEVINVFLWWNHFKMVGYIVEDKEQNSRTILYKRVEQPKSGQSINSIFKFQLNRKFESIATTKHVGGLEYNNEENNYIFYDGCTVNLLKIEESAETQEIELFHQFFNLQGDNLSHFKDLEHPKTVSNKSYKLQIEQIIEFRSNIISMTINDQYLAVLTRGGVSFHSAFDIKSLIFVENLQEYVSEEPSYIQFNKANLMMTFKNSSDIMTFTTKNKSLSFTSTTTLEVNHCKQIMKIYTNHISSEVFCVIMFYELESRMNINSAPSKKVLQSCVQYVIKPAFIDVTTSYLTASPKTEAKILSLSKQTFKKVHTSPWLSSYFIQTEEGIECTLWKETFESKRALALHPTGIFLVVCFKQGFKIYISTFEGLINTYRGDSAKDIQACAIAPSGNDLVIACLNCLAIYDFYSCVKVRTIVLPMGVMIQNIDYHDFSLMCSLRNKKIYIYDSLDEYREVLAFNPKSYVNQPTFKEEDIIGSLINYSISQLGTIVSINQIYYDPILNFIIYSYKATLYFFNCSTNAIVANYQYDPISCIYYNQNLSTLFLGTDNGEVICFTWPNKPSNLLSEQRKFKFHGGRITDIKVTSDLKQLITIGDDQSVCITSLVLVKNLKRFQGLEIIEHMAANIKICYDLLLRKGFCQYTHSKFNDKLEKLKDYEQQVLNINFILPEERMKQKEQMLNNINVNSQELSQKNKIEYSEVHAITCNARDTINKLRQDACRFQSQKLKENEQLKQQLFNHYIQVYNRTQLTELELKDLKQNYDTIRAQQHTKCANQLAQAKDQFEKSYGQILQKYRKVEDNWEHDHMQELGEIQAQKETFIAQNISSLNEVIGDINSNNGILSCKNNKIEKEISELKHKMEEHKYLLHRLQTNTLKIRQEQQKYDTIKQENSKMVEKEDKVNLTQIEKQYVQQTQLLIEKDKQIEVKIVNYEKEKNILIYLEQCVEKIESNIQEVVENILKEKKQKKQESTKIEEIRDFCNGLSRQILTKKKEMISTRNLYRNYVCKLQSILAQIVSSPSKKTVVQALKEQQMLCETIIVKQETDLEEKQMLNKIICTKLYNIQTEGSKTSRGERFRINRTADHFSKNYRKMQTEAMEDRSIPNDRLSPTPTFQFNSSIEAIDKKNKRIIYQLGAEEKQYDRVKTEQAVFENSRKKFNVENVDLVQNYNALVMENKRIMTSLKKQDLLSKTAMRPNKGLKKNHYSTPFLLYLQSRANTQRGPQHVVPTKVYQF